MDTVVENTASTLGNAFQIFGTLDIWNIVFIVALIIICFIVSKLLLVALDKLLKRSRVERTLHTVIKSIARIALIFISILIVADRLGIPVTSLVAVLSVAGLALSLAIQGVLSNVAGGMVVLWSKPFQVGDFIEAGGDCGTVEDITLMYTRILTPDNRTVYLTNKSVSDSKLINISRAGTRRVDLTFTASYTAQPEKVKGAIASAVHGNAKVLAEPAPIIRVGGYGESAIEYHVRAWCASGDYWDVYYDLHEEIKLAFDEAGVEMTYPHVNVHVVEEKAG